MPETGRLSNNDTVQARAAVLAKIALQRRAHAASARPWRTNGTSSARAFANAVRNCAISTLHLPPTSAAKTTKRTLPPSPENSGKVASFLQRASSRAAPSWLAALGLAVPSRRKHHRGVDGEFVLPARESTRQPRLPIDGCPKRRKQPGPCRERMQRAPEESLASPTPLPQNTLRDGGQTDQLGGHIGRCGETGRGEGATSDTGAVKTAERQSWLLVKSGEL